MTQGHNAGTWIAATLLCVAALSLPGCGGSDAELVQVASEKEANRVLVELERWGVRGADKTSREANRVTVWVITVPPELLNAGREVLVRLDLPREPKAGLEAIIENTGLIPTRTDERARLMHAISGELEETFQTYDNIVAARVHVVIPDTDNALSTNKNPPKPSATVVLKYEPPNEPTGNDEQDAKLTIDGVKQIAANAVEGLDPQFVHVALTAAQKPDIDVSAAAATSEGSSGASGWCSGNMLVYQLFGAIVVLALVTIILLIKLAGRGKARAM